MNYELFKMLVFYHVCGKHGAPMGRHSFDLREKGDKQRVHDRYVPVTEGGAYDRGGAYWGLGNRLRCEFTADGLYRHYYREYQ